MGLFKGGLSQSRPINEQATAVTLKFPQEGGAEPALSYEPLVETSFLQHTLFKLEFSKGFLRVGGWRQNVKVLVVVGRAKLGRRRERIRFRLWYAVSLDIRREGES